MDLQQSETKNCPTEKQPYVPQPTPAMGTRRFSDRQPQVLKADQPFCPWYHHPHFFDPLMTSRPFL
jgi:hypothetical protein